jgi:hypothetical protein
MARVGVTDTVAGRRKAVAIVLAVIGLQRASVGHAVNIAGRDLRGRAGQAERRADERNASR